ncbi:MAG: hypothetical protein JO291_02620 [Acidimicrobiia bacterium]|nr:hypothetical protein [Acidimicrobiia bacterium]
MKRKQALAAVVTVVLLCFGVVLRVARVTGHRLPLWASAVLLVAVIIAIPFIVRLDKATRGTRGNPLLFGRGQDPGPTPSDGDGAPLRHEER